MQMLDGDDGDNNIHIVAELESRFSFHSMNEFPVPDLYTDCTKTYPSNASRKSSKLLFIFTSFLLFTVFLAVWWEMLYTFAVWWYGALPLENLWNLTFKSVHFVACGQTEDSCFGFRTVIVYCTSAVIEGIITPGRLDHPKFCCLFCVNCTAGPENE